MHLQIRLVDHDRLVLGAHGSQADHDPCKDTALTPALPAVVGCLGSTAFLWRIAPAQPIAVDKNYAAEDATIVNAGLAVACGRERPEMFHLRLCQPVKITHRSDLPSNTESCRMPEINGSGVKKDDETLYFSTSLWSIKVKVDETKIFVPRSNNIDQR